MATGEFQGDDLTLVVSTCQRGGTSPGQSYTTTNARRIMGWTGVRVTRGIERCPNDFDVEFTEPYPGAADLVIQPGDEVEVYLGADLVISGFVDRYMPGYSARQHTIRVTGRGRCQDLVDCSAYWSGGQFLNTPLLQIAQQLCAAYNIRVVLAYGANQGPPIPQINVLVGEPIYDVLERLCRYCQLLCYEQADGSLLLSAVGTQSAACGFVEGVNVESASATYAMDGRFSDYDAVLMSLNTLIDVGDGGNLLKRVTDSGVPRFRYHAIIAEQMAGATIDETHGAKARAFWEMNRRIGRAFQVRLTTDTWRDSAGALWTPNTLVPLDLPTLKLRQQTWLIADVTYRRDQHRGTTAELLIMPPQAFMPQPIMLFPINKDFQKVM